MEIICSASIVSDNEQMEVIPTKPAVKSNRGRRKRKSEEKDDKDPEEDTKEATSPDRLQVTKKRRSLQCYNSIHVVYT